jgi:hypothetical protein
MDKTAILGQLQQLTGSLKPATGTSADALPLCNEIWRSSSRLTRFTVSGNRLQHEAAEAGPAVDLSARFSHLSDVLTATPAAAAAATPAPAPLVFRRETAFSSILLGNSVPQWGAGMAHSQNSS